MPEDQLNQYRTWDKPIPITDFAKAIRGQMPEEMRQQASGLDDRAIVKGFLTGPAMDDAAWKQAIEGNTLKFYEGTPPAQPSGPPAKAAAAAPKPSVAPTPPGRPETKSAAPQSLFRAITSPPVEPITASDTLSAATKPFLHPFTNPLETLGFGSMRGYEEEKHGAKRKEVGTGGQGPRQEGQGAPVSKSERFVDQAMEELAGFGDALVSPVGILTAGLGPEVRLAAKAMGAGKLVRALGMTERFTRMGYGGMQLANAVHAFTDWVQDPTPENAAKAVTEGGIGALAVAPEAIRTGKAVARTAKTTGEMARNVTQPGRLGAAVKAGAEGFRRGATAEPPEPPRAAESAPEPKPPALPPQAAAPAPAPVAPKPATPAAPAAEAPIRATPSGKLVKAKLEPKDFPVKQGDTFAAWRNRHFTRGENGWESTDGNVFTDERLRDMYKLAPMPSVYPEPKPPAPTPEPVTPSGPRLPRTLAGAKPTYSLGRRQNQLQFESDIDKAAYITAGVTKSKRDAEYLQWGMQQTGLNEAQFRMRGRQIRDKVIRGLSQGSKTGDTLTVPETIKAGAATAAPEPETPEAKSSEERKKAYRENAPKAMTEDAIAAATKEKAAAKPAAAPGFSRLSRQAQEIVTKAQAPGMSATGVQRLMRGVAPGVRQEILSYLKPGAQIATAEPPGAPAKPEPAKTAAPPAPPASREAISNYMGDYVIDRARFNRPEHAFPIEFSWRESNGSVAKERVDTPEELEKIKAKIQAALKDDPGISQISYKGAGQSGIATVDAAKADLAKQPEQQGVKKRLLM